MRNLNITKTVATETTAWETVSAGPLIESYHELADQPVVRLDVLAQLEANVITLEDMHGRLCFLNRELRSILKV